MQASVTSEIGELEAVILHPPGSEVENMNPKNAERALYSDILNLSIAKEEYAQLHQVLQKLTRVYEIKSLLSDIMQIPEARTDLLTQVCESNSELEERLKQLEPGELATQLIEGVILEKNSLTNYLSKERYALRPLHNFFFTRDASMALNNRVLIGQMASQVRNREARIMRALFTYHPEIQTPVIDPLQEAASGQLKDIRIEGGDVLVAREDILIIGHSARTSPQGIDFVINKIKEQKNGPFHILVQEMPLLPESFIHLDMVFTLLDRDVCMLFEPVVLRTNKYQTVHITIDNGEVRQIRDIRNLVSGLNELGMDLEPVYCGGRKDLWTQEREQWHSGANFFAFAPGKLLSYSRNVHTLEELNKKGFVILSSKDVISGRENPDNYTRCVLTLEGSELSRGGGGARCMTLPVRRKAVRW